MSESDSSEPQHEKPSFFHLRWQLSPLTLCFVGLLVALHLAYFAAAWSQGLAELSWSLPLPAPTLIRVGALYAPRMLEDHEWWRILSSSVLHGSLLHLGANSFALLSLAPLCEDLWRTRFYLSLFLVSVLGGALASLASVEGSVVFGASGGLFGIACALLLELWQLGERSPISKSVWRFLAFQIGFWMLLGLFGPQFADITVAGFGHLGGACFGALFWWAIRGQRLSGLGWLVLLFATLGLFPAVDGRWRPQRFARQVGVTELALDRPAIAARLLGEGLQTASAEHRNAWAYAKALSGEDLEAALSQVHRALALEPDKAEYLDTAGWIYCQLGEYDKGRSHIQQALDKLPDDKVIAEHMLHCDPRVLESSTKVSKKAGGGTSTTGNSSGL